MKITKYNTSIHIHDHFLTDDECDQLITLINSKLVESVVTSNIKHHRTSKTHHFDNSDFINHINNKISNHLNINPNKGERLQGQKYDKNQYFIKHTDYFEPNSETYTKHCSKSGNRTFTFMIYLNDNFKGGNTYFNKLDFSIIPKKGRAVFWNSLNIDNSVNPNTEHEGSKIIYGQKYIITKWFRQYKDT